MVSYTKVYPAQHLPTSCIRRVKVCGDELGTNWHQPWFEDGNGPYTTVIVQTLVGCPQPLITSKQTNCTRESLPGES